MGSYQVPFLRNLRNRVPGLSNLLCKYKKDQRPVSTSVGPIENDRAVATFVQTSNPHLAVPTFFLPGSMDRVPGTGFRTDTRFLKRSVTAKFGISGEI